MLSSVPLLHSTVDKYEPVIGAEGIHQLRKAAEPLRDARVLHVSATAFGGGVAELLNSIVPLMQALGVAAEWHVMRGADEFFNVTKSMHNALQGAPIKLDAKMRETFLNYSQMNADLWDQDWDFVIIHDPQPVAIRSILLDQRGSVAGKWIWRCHIDLTHADQDAWDFVRPYIESHHAAVFSMREYVTSDLNIGQIAIIPPSIDPISQKNAELPDDMVTTILDHYGIDTKRPSLVQVSRFDPWKDPLGVIDVYRTAKQQHPELQLILVGAMAHDDPEGWLWFERTARHAGLDEDIRLLTNINGVGSVEVNAIQRGATVVIQKSIREGFGLTVSEALWKKRPVVASNVGGIPAQVINGETGYLVDSTDEAAERVIEILGNPRIGQQLGARGRDHVRQNFLTTSHVQRYLSLFSALSQERDTEEQGYITATDLLQES